MESKWEIVIGSPTDYDELVVYIWINGEPIAIVQKEDGVDKMKIEFFDEPINTEIYLEDFVKALMAAKQELLILPPDA